MQKLFRFAALAVSVSLLSLSVACSRTYVKPGYVGVKVYLHGSNKGVDHEIVSPGAYYVGMNEELYLFPTFLQNYNYTKSTEEGKAVDESFTFQDRNGTSMGADVGISYCFDASKISEVYQKFHKGPDEITNVFLRSAIRDAFNRVASTKSIEEIYGPGKAGFANDVLKETQKSVSAYGLNVERLFLINDLRLPENITKALNEKTEATQKAEKSENELRVVKAEAAKNIAESEANAKAKLITADAEAKANRMIASSLTPALVQKAWVDKWDGKQPQVQGGSNPFINIPLK